MFDDIGNKLQKLAQIFFWVAGAIGVVIFLAGLAGCAGNLEYGFDDIDVIMGLIRMLSAAVFVFYSYIFAAALYGFGKLVNDVGMLKEQQGHE